MTRDELIATAMHAAAHHHMFPDTGQPPHVTEGAAAATVLMADHHGTWILAIHNNAAANHDWHLTGGLAVHTAQTDAARYAASGI